jgi:hypothetical protein
MRLGFPTANGGFFGGGDGFSRHGPLSLGPNRLIAAATGEIQQIGVLRQPRRYI